MHSCPLSNCAGKTLFVDFEYRRLQDAVITRITFVTLDFHSMKDMEVGDFHTSVTIDELAKEAARFSIIDNVI